MTVTVLGATGKTGRAAAEGLLAAGIQVKAVARSADKLAALAKKGVQPVSAEVTDAAALTAALRGSDAAYLMIPSDYTKRICWDSTRAPARRSRARSRIRVFAGWCS